MADIEFEEFRKTFERLPTNYKSATPFYSIVPHLDDDSPSSKSDSSDQDDESQQTNLHQNSAQKLPFNIKSFGCIGSSNNSNNNNSIIIKSNNDGEDDEIGDGLRTINGGFIAGIEGGGSGSGGFNVGGVNGGNFIGGTIGPIVSHSHHHISSHLERTNSLPFMPEQTTERRRRKLPEIPKNKKSSLMLLCGQTPVTDDLRQQQQQQQNNINPPQQNNFHHQQQQQASQSNLISSYTSPMPSQQRSILAFKCSYLLDEDSSPDSDRLHSFGDVDSGHSTAHSPNDFKSMSPALASSPHSPFPPPFGGVPFSQLEMLEATHRGLQKFIPRHHDEMDIEIGDPIYVQKEADDLWCEGVNLRTGRQGIFPSAYVVDLEYNDFDPNAQKVKKERYLLGYLGSVETMAHKGTGVVCQAVRKIVGEYGDSPNGQCCILEISDQGLHMVERSTSQGKEKKKPCIDYFYSLKNVSFCAFHPRDHRYIGFITKHPTIHRFACHVFKGNESTRPVAEAVGRAFQHFYQKFIEKAYPIEDIYIE